MMDNFSNFLRQENSVLWNLANSEHPFVKGLGDGSLSLDKFQYYLKQDYIFLFDYFSFFLFNSEIFLFDIEFHF